MDANARCQGAIVWAIVGTYRYLIAGPFRPKMVEKVGVGGVG